MTEDPGVEEAPTEKSFRARWTRWVREWASIVAAILVAFALDAWWENSSEAARAGALLDVISEEFEVAAVELDSILAANDAWIGNTTNALRRAAEGTPPIPPDSLMVFGAGLDLMQFYEPEFGALESLLNSGGLEDIDVGIARRLGGWPSRLEDPERQTEAIGIFSREVAMASAAAGVLVPVITDGPDPLHVRRSFRDERLRQAFALVVQQLTAYQADLRRIRDEARMISELLKDR